MNDIVYTIDLKSIDDKINRFIEDELEFYIYTFAKKNLLSFDINSNYLLNSSVNYHRYSRNFVANSEYEEIRKDVINKKQPLDKLKEIANFTFKLKDLKRKNLNPNSVFKIPKEYIFHYGYFALIFNNIPEYFYFDIYSQPKIESNNNSDLLIGFRYFKLSPFKIFENENEIINELITSFNDVNLSIKKVFNCKNWNAIKYAHKIYNFNWSKIINSLEKNIKLSDKNLKNLTSPQKYLRKESQINFDYTTKIIPKILNKLRGDFKNGIIYDELNHIVNPYLFTYLNQNENF